MYVLILSVLFFVLCPSLSLRLFFALFIHEKQNSHMFLFFVSIPNNSADRLGLLPAGFFSARLCAQHGVRTRRHPAIYSLLSQRGSGVGGLNEWMNG